MQCSKRAVERNFVSDTWHSPDLIPTFGSKAANFMPQVRNPERFQCYSLDSYLYLMVK